MADKSRDTIEVDAASFRAYERLMEKANSNGSKKYLWEFLVKTAAPIVVGIIMGIFGTVMAFGDRIPTADELKSFRTTVAAFPLHEVKQTNEYEKLSGAIERIETKLVDIQNVIEAVHPRAASVRERRERR